jgi:hypothetical protein
VGHISVFPNDVESLAVRILPHPLVSALDQVHVIWTGVERPRPLDVSKLLSVRPGVLRTALEWLRVNNLLYADIVINEEEMDSWSFEDGSQVPTLAYQRMVREQETAEEAIRTAQIVPPADRGQDVAAQPSTVEDIATELAERSGRSLVPPERAPSARPPRLEEATAEETVERLFELRSSAMFPIDDQAAFAEQDKLEFISLALQAEHQSDDNYEAGAGEASSMQVYGSSERPFIRVSRGSEFADAFSPDYFPKTFPCCFPYGRGGPQVAGRHEEGGPANPLLRDMTLESWAKVVLQRHGGHFAQHPVFAFLIFNILVRSRNRRIGQGRLKRSAFQRIEGIHRRLTPERLRGAQKEMLETGKTTDEDVLALMKELSLYGSRHPLSNESRLSMRKKVWSMIVAFGLAAIWFTLNPNDITNTHRTGPLCTSAFAMTDQKSQGKQFSDVLVNLKGVHSSGTATRPSFMSLYVQLSRAESWDGLHLFRTPARGDFIEPKNVLDKDMREAIVKLERRGDDTRRRFERDHRHMTWFQEWAAIPETAQATDAVDEEDASLWCDT